jgi:hypothetical protein
MKRRPALLLLLSVLPCALAAPAAAQTAGPGGKPAAAPVRVPQAHAEVIEQSTCESLRDFATEVHVNLLQPETRYDFSEKSTALRDDAARQFAAMAARNKLDILWHADDTASGGAYSIGAWAVSYDIQKDSRPVDTYGAFYCPYIRRAQVDILYTPMAMWPSDAPKGTCGYAAVSELTGPQLLAAGAYMKAVTAQIEDGLKTMIAQMGKAPYVPRSGLPKAQREMDDNIRGAVQVYYGDAIRKQLAERIAAIDSAQAKAQLEARIAACPPGKAPLLNLFGK